MKGKLWRLLLPVLAVVVILLVLPVQAQAAELTPLSDFTYTVENDAVVLSRYTGSGTVVTVPGSYELEGTVYPVVLVSSTVFRATGVTEVTLLEGVDFKENSMALLFAQCSKLTKADINAPDTSDIINMAYLFYDCKALQSLDLSGLETGAVKSMQNMFTLCNQLANFTGYESWDTGSLLSMYQMFADVKKLSVIDLSGWDLDQVVNTGWCFQNCTASQIKLPQNLAVISAGFMNHASGVTGSSFAIPQGTQRIGYAHTFYDFGTSTFAEFTVEQGNTAYKTVDGILYSADGTELLAIPKAKTFPGNVFTVPEGVNFMGELSFSRNYNISTLVLPDSFVLKTVPVNDPAYIIYQDVGNLNAGTNLSIAVYKTGISAYSVAESNPNYKALDGILYSKDMTAVAAIPTAYKGKIVIPAGVTAWKSEALWAPKDTDSLLEGCTGVTIPASCTQIAQDQIDKINRLAVAYDTFVITVDAGNEKYYVNEKGQLDNKVPVNITMTQLDLRLQDLLRLGFHFDVSTQAQILEIGALMWTETDYAKESYFDINSTLATRYTDLGTANGSYVVESAGIRAQDLDDVYYFRAYVKTDAGYTYGKCVSGSGLQYAQIVYGKTEAAWADTRSLVIDLLNYATAAQNYFALTEGEKLPETPLNSFLSEADKTVAWNDGLKRDYATVTETTGAFKPSFQQLHGNLLDAIRLNFTFNGNDVRKMLYWTEKDYAASAVHDSTTCTGLLAYEESASSVTGRIYSIYAYNIYDNYYVRACDASGTMSRTYGTSVAAYVSQLIDTYGAKTDRESQALVALCKAMLVYGNNADTNPAVDRG